MGYGWGMDFELRNIAVARGGRPLLSGVGFTLAPGSALVLRGPNGAGKTTLLRAIAGLQPVLSGEIFGAGERVAYAGHADGIKTTLTVTENLDFWADVFGSDQRDEAIRAFDLVPLANRPAGQLSAGQRRRLGLARLLVTGRPLWLLDEPTVSLDQNAVALFASVVQAHLDRGGQALMATHIDLGLKAKILDISRFRPRVQTKLGTSDEAFL